MQEEGGKRGGLRSCSSGSWQACPQRCSWRSCVCLQGSPASQETLLMLVVNFLNPFFRDFLFLCT